MVRILITNGTGLIGKNTIPILLNKYPSAHIRAIVKDKVAAEELFVKELNKKNSHRLEFIEMDLYKMLCQKTLPKKQAQDVFFGVSTVFMVLRPHPKQPQLEKKFIQFSIDNNVKHIVKMSVTGANINDRKSSIGYWHAKSEEYLYDMCTENGVGFTILRGNLFMQNFVNDAKNIKTKSTLYRPKMTTKNYSLSLVDINDFCEAASEVLSNSGIISKHNGKTYLLSGPDSLSFGQICDKFSQLLGRQITFSPIEPIVYHKQLEKLNKYPEYVIHFLVALWIGYEKDSESPLVTPDIEYLLNRKPLSFDVFLKNNAQYFQ